MPKVPRVTGQEIIKAFQRAGFVVVHSNGSHFSMKKPGHSKRLCIPVHGGRTVGVGLLRSQIAAAGISVERFIEYLNH